MQGKETNNGSRVAADLFAPTLLVLAVNIDRHAVRDHPAPAATSTTLWPRGRGRGRRGGRVLHWRWIRREDAVLTPRNCATAGQRRNGWWEAQAAQGGPVGAFEPPWPTGRRRLERCLGRRRSWVGDVDLAALASASRATVLQDGKSKRKVSVPGNKCCVSGARAKGPGHRGQCDPLGLADSGQLRLRQRPVQVSTVTGRQLTPPHHHLLWLLRLQPRCPRRESPLIGRTHRLSWLPWIKNSCPSPPWPPLALGLVRQLRHRLPKVARVLAASALLALERRGGDASVSTFIKYIYILL